ncbi:MAG: glycosyltransferase family 4 protein [Planctomycetota bacterium]|jgi:glycosyltransferase involved in cell wall biosynthesis
MKTLWLYERIMKIGINFHTSDEYISGVEYYSLGLLNALLNIDADNQYVVYTNRPDFVREHLKASANLTIAGLARLKTRLRRILWEHTQLPRLAARDNLDVLHCLSYICPVRKTSVPCVVTVHDTIAIDYPRWCKQTNALYFNLFMKAACKKASYVISVSKRTADDIKRNFRLPCSKIRVVYPGIDGIFHPKEDCSRQDTIRKRYNLPERYVLYVGNIEPKKNTRVLFDILTRLREEGLPHKLVFAGRRTWRSKAELEEISRGVGSNDIIPAGYVARSDLPSVYQMADVFVFPSLYEGFGFPPLEAMACGTPVVSSRKGALNETIGDSAYTVDPQNSDQIGRAVISMIQDRLLRERHVRMGLERSGMFNWEKSARETLSVYEEACTANA